MDDMDSPAWLLLTHFSMLSMMAIGGGVVMLAPDIHRFVVDVHPWMSSEQFTSAYTIAQAAPGPNMLFVTLLGWQVAGWLGAIAATVGIVLPPTLLTLLLMHFSGSVKVGRVGRAFRTGIAPLSVGLLMAGGWVLMRTEDINWHATALTLLTIAILLKTKCNPIWLILMGAVVGMLGLV